MLKISLRCELQCILKFNWEAYKFLLFMKNLTKSLDINSSIRVGFLQIYFANHFTSVRRLLLPGQPGSYCRAFLFVIGQAGRYFWTRAGGQVFFGSGRRACEFGARAATAAVPWLGFGGHHFPHPTPSSPLSASTEQLSFLRTVHSWLLHAAHLSHSSHLLFARSVRFSQEFASLLVWEEIHVG